MAALRAALTVTSQRETKDSQRSQWYRVRQCYNDLYLVHIEYRFWVFYNQVIGDVRLRRVENVRQHCTFLFQQCFDETQKPFDETQMREKKMTREDWTHGSLLIINELLRCSNVEGEVLLTENH